MNSPTPEETARQCAEIMWPDDHAAQGLGIEVLDVGPGSARVTMTVRQDMVNVHGTCHGGFIFAVADTAFAYACNSYNELTVASGFAIDLLAPSHAGDVLTARASEVFQAGRSGVYDVEVRNQRDERIAVFRGRSHRMKDKPVVPHKA